MIFPPIVGRASGTAGIAAGRRDRNGLQILSVAECWQLLTDHELGCIGLCDGPAARSRRRPRVHLWACLRPSQTGVG
jgi:hypothetical protein